ncbi:MAG: hypothetical protein BGO26_20600 [Actinobacteria bacterium 69-20]|jgi:peptide/nickel transport system ATP-binding protein|nr:ABC transporter ATP-binding protein [Actinomycetota bacterium]OJV25061.1 MAG: hypothetical protein BGO26_20600 [Actinobacteria bacterium 69-20]
MTDWAATDNAPLLSAHGATIRYGNVVAVAGVDLAIPPGQARIALVGESGSGKTTVLRALLGLVPTGAGEIRYRGTPLRALNSAQRADFRAAVQPVFQDGNEALDPRMRARASIAEALRMRRDDGDARTTVSGLLEDVGLEPDLADRYPHELSGGQRQRVIIARALAAQPTLLLLDEPTSALDVIVQQHILELLGRLCDERGLSILLVTHNLAVARQLCDTANVMHHGKIIESGPIHEVLTTPREEYTKRLVAAVPKLRR